MLQESPDRGPARIGFESCTLGLEMRTPAIFLFAAALQAQIFVPVGTNADGCVGGNTWASPALRFGTSFTCTVNTNQPGAYHVTLGFIEPSVTTIGGRVFSATVGLAAPAAFQSIDLVALGAAPGVLIMRSAILATIDGALKIQLTATTRSAVLSSITILPYLPGPAGAPGPAGPAGPPGPAPDMSGFVPYVGATQNLDLGQFGLYARFENLRPGQTPDPLAGRIWMGEVAAVPADTKDWNGTAYPWVLYWDPADHKLKALYKDGTLYTFQASPPAQ